MSQFDIIRGILERAERLLGRETRELTMVGQTELVRQAKMIPTEERKRILTSFKETELHGHIKELLLKMDPDSLVEVTHGAEEHGNDLVRVRKDIFGESVVGIIVEVGNIGAKTMGRVDEVKSKIDQCFAHPVRLKITPNVLFVSEVSVMLAGELTKTASKRLEREKRNRNIKIVGLDWLIENFTTHYPEVFFEGKVMDFFQRKIRELEEKYPFSKRGKNLSECFVEPLVAAIDIPATFDEENFALIVEKQRVPFSRMKGLFQLHRKLILAGDPGVGKTVALAKFVIDRLHESWGLATQRKLGKQVEIPVLIPAKEFLQLTNVQALIEEYISYPEIIDRLKVTAILIDGLDEVRPEQRNEVLERATDFSEQLNCPLVVTSRKIDLIKNPPAGFQRYELLPFEFGQALRFFQNLTADTQILHALQDGLERVKYQIPMTPLSLLLLIEIAENYKEIPASLCELYDRFSDIVLGRYDREKGIEVLFEYLIKKRFLSELALKEFLEKQRLEIPIEEFQRFVSNYASVYGWDEKMLEGFMKEIERAGLLDLREMVAFEHRSFLDYFAAFRIYDKWEDFKDLEDFIAQIYFDDFYGDVALFYIGLRRDISTSMLSKVFEFQKEGIIADIDKFLSGRLLQAAWHAPTKTKYEGIEKAINFAPMVKEDFLELVDKSSVPIPRIFSDVLVMVLAELSFGSIFLLKEAEGLFSALSGQPEQKISYEMLSLLWGIQRLLPLNELRGMINSILDTMSKVPSLSAEQEAVALLFLTAIEQRDKRLGKSLKRNLHKLSRRYPEVFRGLLPPSPKGFRRRQVA